MGRKSRFSEEEQAEIKRLAIEGVTSGMSLRKTCRENGWPESLEGTIRLWVTQDVEFATQYDRARMCRADARADRVDEIAALVETKDIDPQQARILFDIERWQAGRENSKKYSERTTLQGADDAPPIKLEGNMNPSEKRDLARWIAERLSTAASEAGEPTQDA